MNSDKFVEDNINLNDERIKVIDDYNIKSKSNSFKQDLFFDDENHDYNKFFVNYHKTISYSSNAKINDDSEQKNKKNYYLNNSLENNKNYIISINKGSFSDDKFIRTSPNLFSIQNVKMMRNKYLAPIHKDIKNVKIHKYNTNYLGKNTRIFSSTNPSFFSKTFYEKCNNLSNPKKILYKLINKQKASAIKTYFQNKMLNEFYNNKIIIKNHTLSNDTNIISSNSTEKKKKHHNLLTIENIFSQRKTLNNYLKPYFNHNENYNKNLKSSLSKKKYTINEIKFPLYNNLIKKDRVINDNNGHLLEKIFKNQTLSNFNNKYTFKYKTSSSIKKENIKNLFSLLKKYKNSDRDKQTAFNKYNSLNNKRKFFKF
jgi:hypothetical protein